MWIADIVRSAKEIHSRGMLEELCALRYALAGAEHCNPRVRGLVLEQPDTVDSNLTETYYQTGAKTEANFLLKPTEWQRDAESAMNSASNGSDSAS